MWRWFGFKDNGTGEIPAYGAEVLQAGWVAPMPLVEAPPAAPARAAEELKDIAAFLTRVYANQAC